MFRHTNITHIIKQVHQTLTMSPRSKLASRYFSFTISNWSPRPKLQLSCYGQLHSDKCMLTHHCLVVCINQICGSNKPKIANICNASPFFKLSPVSLELQVCILPPWYLVKVYVSISGPDIFVSKVGNSTFLTSWSLCTQRERIGFLSAPSSLSIC